MSDLECCAHDNRRLPLWTRFCARFHHFELVKSQTFKFNDAQTSFLPLLNPPRRPRAALACAVMCACNHEMALWFHVMSLSACLRSPKI